MEKLSGIKAHTIRIWEQRYGLLEPKRTDTNIRYYDDNDLRFLLNIALLNKNGLKVSKIAKMNELELSEKVAELSEVSQQYSTQLDALTISAIEMDEFKFDKIISVNIEQLGFERTMLEVILPFTEKLGLLWLTGSISPIQENFISYLIRQKLISAIDQLPFQKNKGAAKFLLYLPKGERQELSLLFFHYLLRKRGLNTIYMGHDISLLDLKDAHKVYSPDYIYTMITETFTKGSVRSYVQNLSKNFPDTKLLLSGYQVVAQDVPSTGNIHVLKSLIETIEFMDKSVKATL